MPAPVTYKIPSARCINSHRETKITVKSMRKYAALFLYWRIAPNALFYSTNKNKIPNNSCYNFAHNGEIKNNTARENDFSGP